MPYLCETEPNNPSGAELTAWLNQLEADGWTLRHITPGFTDWQNGLAIRNGVHENWPPILQWTQRPMYIFYKP